MRKITNIFLITNIWFSLFTGKSDVVSYGEPRQGGYGNFFVWNIKSNVTSLHEIINLNMLFVDYIISFAITFLIAYLFKNTKYLQSKKLLIILSIISFISITLLCFMLFGFTFEITNDYYPRILNSYSFSFRY